MAKTKKVIESSNVENKGQEISGGSQSDSKDKPVKKNLKTNFKLHAFGTPEEMVTKALKSFSKDGGNLTKIRNYIAKNYNNGKRLGKGRQQIIKDYIIEKFESGDIEMTNSDADKINFNMSFAMAADHKGEK